MRTLQTEELATVAGGMDTSLRPVPGGGLGYLYDKWQRLRKRVGLQPVG